MTIARWGRPGSDQDNESSVSVTRQVRDEVEAHFAMLVREGMARGMSAEQAELDARRRFGDVHRYAREGRAIRLRRLRVARRAERWAGLLHDLRSATRALRSSPGFVAGAVLMLGVGIGITTALFSITSAILFRPLPFDRPEELFVLRGAPITLSPGLRAAEDVLDWQPRVARSFAALAAYQPFGQSVNVTGFGEPQHAIATEVSPGFFSVLGTRMVAGRAFSAEEANANRQVAVIGERFWRRQWAADPEVVGRVIQVNGRPYRVLGIVPSRAQLPAEVELWVPIGYAFEDIVVHGARFFSVLGRTRPGVSREAMERDVAKFRSWLDESVVQTMQARGDRELVAVSLLDSLVGSVRRPLWLLLAATVLVLVVTNANVANFMASRSRWRRREYAVRAALGAGTRRLIQQAIAESLLLAVGGGVLGAMVAAWSLGAVRALEHISLPRSESLAADWRLFGFALLLAAFSALATGLLPALAAARTNLGGMLRAGASRARVGAGRSRPRDTLLVVQVAVALLLALGAGLLTRTYAELQRVDAGFSRQALSFAVTLDGQAYPSWAETEELTARLITELKQLPGVREVGAGNLLPLADATFFGLGWRVVGALEGEKLFATYLSVTPGYLEAMGLDAMLGRTITEADTRDVPLVGVANEAFVREHLAGRSPIGARLLQVGTENTVEIIGVVGDVRRTGMREKATPELYLSMAQVHTGPSYFVVGVDRYRSGLAAELLAAVRRVDPELPIFDVRTMDDRIAGSLIRPRLLAWLFAGFAFAAVTLAAFGLYAAVHHWIATRTYEIGVRMAVGADGRSVLGLFLRQGALRLIVGLAVGLAAYGAVARHLDEALLFGVRRGDPATLLSMVAVLAGVALAAILAAAARAVALDPVRALRAE